LPVLDSRNVGEVVVLVVDRDVDAVASSPTRIVGARDSVDDAAVVVYVDDVDVSSVKVPG